MNDYLASSMLFDIHMSNISPKQKYLVSAKGLLFLTAEIRFLST